VDETLWQIEAANETEQIEKRIQDAFEHIDAEE
jgi:hypothetical protein